MTEFLYPPNIVEKIKARWKRVHARGLRGPAVAWELKNGEFVRVNPKKHERVDRDLKAEGIPFPDDDALIFLLDTLYHTSLLTEERRSVGARVMYLPVRLPERLKKFDINLQGEPIRLLPPFPLTAAQLARLAPAVDPKNSLIVVGNAEELGLPSEPPLAVWGILHLGSDWWELVSGRSSGALAPPDCLTLSTFSPGSLVISTLGEVLVRLRDGKLVKPPLGSLREGPIGAFLGSAAEQLYVEACKELGRTRYDDEEDSDDHPRNRYYSTLSNVLARARERRHGAVFVIIPDELALNDSRVSDRIRAKYVIQPPSIWQTLVREAVAESQYFELYLPKKPRNKGATKKSRIRYPLDLHDACQLHQTLEKEIQDFESFAASLAGVDGAVLLTKRLQILGFGCEIVAASPTLDSIKIAESPDGKGGPERPIASFGTRHRSAFRFCSSYEDSVCLVVSQDGQVRGIKRVGQDVVMWEDLNLSPQAL